MRLNNLKNVWQSNSPEQRAGLRILIAACLGLAAYFIHVPLEKTRNRLQQTLPHLAQTFALMQHQAQDIVRLRQLPAPQSIPLNIQIVQQLADAPFAKQTLPPQVIANNQLRLTITHASFDDWLRWEDQLQKQTAIRLQNVKIEALPVSGMVKIEATFSHAQD